MRCLIRYITRKSAAGVGHTDREAEGDSLVIGRGTDADIFLPDLRVALHHARLRRGSDGRFSLLTRSAGGVAVNGRLTETASVGPGDTITVGRSTLRLADPDGYDDPAIPEGVYDLLIEVEEGRSQSAGRAETGPISLVEAGLRRRRWAWLLFLATLFFGLGVPLADYYQSGGTESGAVAGGEASAAGESDGPSHAVPGWLVPDVPWSGVAGGDRLWLSGPMTRSHSFLTQDCRACHQQLFQRVRDAACLECHEGQPHHADARELMAASGLSERRCAGCHREHRGRDSLVMADPELCSDCHARPDERMPDADVRRVAGFGGGDHPQFRTRVVSRAEGGDFEWRRTRMEDGLREANGLIFPHDAHLEEEGVEGPDGKERLACRDCHRPGSQGVAMEPVRFERDCRRCHELNFEPTDPDREVPHGDPEAAVSMLEEYYARVALAGGYRREKADPPPVVRRQRPSARELDETERRTALDWASEQADKVAAELFANRTCKLCHSVERDDAAPSGWRVAPVAMTQDWFPRARFTHAAHRRVSCTDCHGAEASGESSDVLMPGIETCRECHGEPHSQASLATRCVDCHRFHAAERLRMGSTRGEEREDASQ